MVRLQYLYSYPFLVLNKSIELFRQEYRLVDIDSLLLTDIGNPTMELYRDVMPIQTDVMPNELLVRLINEQSLVKVIDKFKFISNLQELIDLYSDVYGNFVFPFRLQVFYTFTKNYIRLPFLSVLEKLEFLVDVADNDILEVHIGSYNSLLVSYFEQIRQGNYPVPVLIPLVNSYANIIDYGYDSQLNTLLLKLDKPLFENKPKFNILVVIVDDRVDSIEQSLIDFNSDIFVSPFKLFVGYKVELPIDELINDYNSKVNVPFSEIYTDATGLLFPDVKLDVKLKLMDVYGKQKFLNIGLLDLEQLNSPIDYALKQEFIHTGDTNLLILKLTYGLNTGDVLTVYNPDTKIENYFEVEYVIDSEKVKVKSLSSNTTEYPENSYVKRHFEIGLLPIMYLNSKYHKLKYNSIFQNFTLDSIAVIS